MRDDARGFLFEMLEMTAGPLLWFAHLVVVYGATSLACSRQGERILGSESVAAVTAVSTVLALGATAWLIARGARELAGPPSTRARDFVDRVTIALGVFAAVAILWTALPALLGPACPAQ